MGTVFYKIQHHRLALYCEHFFDWPAVNFLKAGGQVQQVHGVLCTELCDVQQVFVGPVVAIVGIHNGTW